jgi:hypothetical protein
VGLGYNVFVIALKHRDTNLIMNHGGPITLPKDHSVECIFIINQSNESWQQQ